MRIEVFSDVICPWCFVGEARLRAALAARADVAVEVIWLPFELNPDLPAEGRDRIDYLRERFGDEHRFAAAQAPLQALGHSLGIEFAFDAIRRAPNTRRAHMLAAHARRMSAESQSRVIRRLFETHFSEGGDVGDPEILTRVALDCGLEPDAARAALEDGALRAEIETLEALAHRWQVSGVPTFVFERRFAFSGAQPEEAFLAAIDRCLN